MRIIEAYAHATTVQARGAVMLGDEMIDEASRKMAEVIVARVTWPATPKTVKRRNEPQYVPSNIRGDDQFAGIPKRMKIGRSMPFLAQNAPTGQRFDQTVRDGQ